MKGGDEGKIIFERGDIEFNLSAGESRQCSRVSKSKSCNALGGEAGSSCHYNDIGRQVFSSS